MGKAQATRSAILQHAVDLASKEGLEGLTIGRLASDLAMSKSGLFAHFGSKQDLQMATIEAAGMRFYEAVIAPAASVPEGAPRLRTYCERYMRTLRDGLFSGGCFWAAASAEFDDKPGPVREAIQQAVRAWLGELQRQAQIAGAEDPYGLAFEIYSLGLGANAFARLLDDHDAVSRASEALERRLLATHAIAESTTDRAGHATAVEG
jgi:AcrR family transcriptional regulator